MSELIEPGAVIIGLLSTLLAVIGWLGTRVITRLDDLVNRLDQVKDDMHTRMSRMENRLTKVETLVMVKE